MAKDTEQTYLDFDRYIRQGEPGLKRREETCRTATGLQAADGLTASECLQDTSLNLTPSQKQAVFKLAVELVKADKRIHSREIEALRGLQEALALGQEQMDLIHYCTMQGAIEALKSADNGDKDILCELFGSIMCSDNDIDFDERVLLSAVTMSIRSESGAWCSVITIPFVDSPSSERQIIFLEKQRCRAAHAVFDDAYDNLLISKAFGDIGLKFLYLPDITRRLNLQLGAQGSTADGKFELLKRSMEFIVPAGNKIKLNNLDSALSSLDTPTFLRVILSRYGLSEEIVPYEALLLLKISDSQVLNDSNNLEGNTNFLCIDLSRDVKKRIFEFISRFDEQEHLISYEGYYKFIYDYLSSESKSVKPIRLDAAYQFYAGDGTPEQIVFESSPQARTFYLLLLFYGPYGIRQSLFKEAIDILGETEQASGGNFDYQAFKSRLADRGDEASRLIINTMEIYRSVSTKDDESPEFVRYVASILRHRSSLKNYINKGFASCEILANRERFEVSYDAESKSYSVNAGLSDFLIGAGADALPLKDSSLWKSLK